VYFADNAASNRVPYLVNINSSYGMYLNFSPFYGKINTFNLIYYIHWSFGIGYAIYNTSNNYDAYLQETTDFFTDRDRRGPTAKTQIKWYLSRMFTVNVDFVGYWFKDREPVADSALKFRNYSDIIFSLGLTF
jgi:hypothetical protein